MKKIILILVVLVALAGSGIFFWQQRTGASKQVTEEFKYEAITRGDLENMVSSTGTLSAVGTVDIGSQISGLVDKVLVDYNDQVKKGDLLAVMDKTVLETTVRDAEASLARSQAELKQAETASQRNETLLAKGYVSEMTSLESKTNVETAKAAVVSAQAALKKARLNLKYAEIRSPIDGTVISRSVEVGQTISAGQNTTTLFKIAQNLTQMQIEASVDESDIGQIKEGLPVRFTVQAYESETFTGTVRQVRLQPKTVQDVVNYTVVVDATNDKGLLLPGMTATVEFIIDERRDVLLIPNTALSFKPSETLLAQLRQQFQAQNGQRAQRNATDQTTVNNGNGQQQANNSAESGAQGQPPMMPPQGQAGQNGTPMMPPPSGTNGQQLAMANGNGNGERQMPANMARVFYLDNDGNPKMARITKGVSDGSKTEVLESSQILEGTRVIIGTGTTTKTTTKESGFGLPLPGLGGPPGGAR
jgi:HlyD family secretion protein